MTKDSGILLRIAAAAGSAVEVVATKVGLSAGSDSGTPKSKSERKARHKATIARIEKEDQAAKASKRSR